MQIAPRVRPHQRCRPAHDGAEQDAADHCEKDPDRDRQCNHGYVDRDIRRHRRNRMSIDEIAQRLVMTRQCFEREMPVPAHADGHSRQDHDHDQWDEPPERELRALPSRGNAVEGHGQIHWRYSDRHRPGPTCRAILAESRPRHAPFHRLLRRFTRLWRDWRALHAIALTSKAGLPYKPPDFGRGAPISQGPDP